MCAPKKGCGQTKEFAKSVQRLCKKCAGVRTFSLIQRVYKRCAKSLQGVTKECAKSMLIVCKEGLCSSLQTVWKECSKIVMKIFKSEQNFQKSVHA